MAPVTGDLPSLNGQLVADTDSLRWASEDWGHIVHHTPRAVFRPRTAADIGAVAKIAARRQLPLVPRGQGHSWGGQAQSHGGIIVDMNRLDAIRDITVDRVVVDAGARWSQVLAATLPHGLTPPVLTDYLELSVGGTLSVGGLAGTSHRHGLQTDNVLELDVVTPAGGRMSCSPTREPALFDAIRAGRGASGIIIRATLHLIPAHTHAVRHKLRYRELAQFLADQRQLINSRCFDHIAGQAKIGATGWHYVTEAANFYSGNAAPRPNAVLDRLNCEHTTSESTSLPYFDFLNQLAPLEASLRDSGAWHYPHPWVSLFLPDTTANAIISRTMAELRIQDIGDTGRVVLYPFFTDKIMTPTLRIPDAPIAFSFSLLRTGPADDPAATARLSEANEALSKEVRASGGAIYL